MTKSFDVAVVGATGIVGATLLGILEQRKFPINNIYFLASHRSAGDVIDFKKKSYIVENVENFDFSKAKISFFCASVEVSAKYAPVAAKAGSISIDKSSCFRYDKEVPLIIPEVNASDIANYTNKSIIASPNCSTTPVLVAIKPIHDAVGIKRINVTTFQSVSGSGKDAIMELAEQTTQLLSGMPIKPKVYSKQIAFNILPQIDSFFENGYTREEMKIIWETQKILDENIKVNATAVRVPVFYGHAASVQIETKEKLTATEALELLLHAKGVKLFKDEAFPTPVNDAAGKDAVFVGRVREDISVKNGLNLWAVTDNLRKGAALNAVQIAEELIKDYL